MAVTVGLGPVTGLTLPLLSMGGTSQLFMGISLGIMSGRGRSERRGANCELGRADCRPHGRISGHGGSKCLQNLWDPGLYAAGDCLPSMYRSVGAATFDYLAVRSSQCKATFLSTLTPRTRERTSGSFVFVCGRGTRFW